MVRSNTSMTDALTSQSGNSILAIGDTSSLDNAFKR